MADNDISVVAARMLVTYGRGAVSVLDRRSDLLRKAGKPGDAAMWKQVADAVMLLLRENWTQLQ